MQAQNQGEKSNEVDASPKSSLTETTAPLVTTPSAPLNFKASAGDGNVNLEWREPSDNGGSPITNYNIYRGTTPGGEALRGGVSNVLNYTDDIVINNQTYYYQVSAENSAGEGDMSDEASATLIPGETVPSAPQDLNADRGDEYVDLSWNPPSNDGGSPIMKYKVYRGMAPRGEEFVAEIDNAVNYRDYYVTNDRQYYYQVSAVNLPGEGEMSNEVEVDVAPRGDTLGMGVWITIIVALIGALGVIAAALINYLSSKKTKYHDRHVKRYVF
jgi:titin